MYSEERSQSWRSSKTFLILVVAVGQFSDLFIYGMLIPVLPFLLRSRVGGTPEMQQTQLAIMLSTFSTASLLFAFPAGWLGDLLKTRRHVLYLAGLLALFAATMLLAFAEAFPLLVVSRALQGASAAVVYTAGHAMVIDAVDPGELGKTLGLVCSHRS